MRLESQAAEGERPMTVRKMTGFGFYGQPHHITKMLAKVLVRFDRVPLAIRQGDLRANGGATIHDGQRSAGWRCLKAGSVCIATPRNAQLTGFYLSMTDGRAELHFYLRGTRQGDAQVKGA